MSRLIFSAPPGTGGLGPGTLWWQIGRRGLEQGRVCGAGRDCRELPGQDASCAHLPRGNPGWGPACAGAGALHPQPSGARSPRVPFAFSPSRADYSESSLLCWLSDKDQQWLFEGTPASSRKHPRPRAPEVSNLLSLCLSLSVGLGWGLSLPICVTDVDSVSAHSRERCTLWKQPDFSLKSSIFSYNNSESYILHHCYLF